MTPRWLVIAAPLVLIASFVGACNTHGEGGRCDKKLNGDNDCASGFTCVSGGDLILPDSGGAHSGADVCCPSDRTQATTDICRQAPPTPGSDASIPDSGTEASVTDATVDQSAADAADDADGAIDDGAADAPDGD